jgi:hypothetical protein
MKQVKSWQEAHGSSSELSGLRKSPVLQSFLNFFYHGIFDV